MGVSEEELQGWTPESIYNIAKAFNLGGVSEAPKVKKSAPLTATDIQGRIRRTKIAIARSQKRGETPTIRQRLCYWDEERAAACQGNDPLAQECSMNNYLWYFWQLAKKRGEQLSGRQIAHLKRTKEAFAQFFVPEVSGVPPVNVCLFSPVHVAPAGTQERKNFEQVFEYLLKQLQNEKSTRL